MIVYHINIVEIHGSDVYEIGKKNQIEECKWTIERDPSVKFIKLTFNSLDFECNGLNPTVKSDRFIHMNSCISTQINLSISWPTNEQSGVLCQNLLYAF